MTSVKLFTMSSTSIGMLMKSCLRRLGGTVKSTRSTTSTINIGTTNFGMSIPSTMLHARKNMTQAPMSQPTCAMNVEDLRLRRTTTFHA